MTSMNKNAGLQFRLLATSWSACQLPKFILIYDVQLKAMDFITLPMELAKQS